MADIEIIIDDNGEVIIDGEGFDGKGCEKALGEYLKALGKEKSSKKKAEFYQKNQQIGQSNKVGGS